MKSLSERGTGRGLPSTSWAVLTPRSESDLSLWKLGLASGWIALCLGLTAWGLIEMLRQN